jgi:hypothetical protein
VQPSLKVEAVEQQLAEESIAEELRREKGGAARRAAAMAAAAAGGRGGGGGGEVIIEDIFSKDFGKTKKRRKSRSTKTGGNDGGSGAGAGEAGDHIVESSSPPSPGIGRDRASPAFRRELALSLGFASPGDTKAVVDRGLTARSALVTHNVGLALSIAQVRGGWTSCTHLWPIA